MLADVARILRGIVRKFAWSCTVRAVNVAGAGREEENYAVGNKVVRASLHFLCYTLGEHRVHFSNKSRNWQLQERVFEVTESDSSDFVGFPEFQSKAENPCKVSSFESAGAPRCSPAISTAVGS